VRVDRVVREKAPVRVAQARLYVRLADVAEPGLDLAVRRLGCAATCFEGGDPGVVILAGADATA
jgi:hypothetical protein